MGTQSVDARLDGSVRKYELSKGAAAAGRTRGREDELCRVGRSRVSGACGLPSSGLHDTTTRRCRDGVKRPPLEAALCHNVCSSTSVSALEPRQVFRQV